MNITIISVGKLKEKYLKQAIDEYSKRLSRYCKLDIIELQDEKTPDNASEKEELQIKDKEGELILSKIKDRISRNGEYYIDWTIAVGDAESKDISAEFINSRIREINKSSGPW